MATSTKAEVFYRQSDGKPMGETREHREAMVDLILQIEDWFADDPLTYTSGDDFLYWVEGQPRFNVSPDVWCVRGIDKTVQRRVYKTWLEGGKAPDFVVDVTSKSTRREDLSKKFRIYQDDLKVREYFLFDPLDEYLKPRFQGHRLVEGQYRPIEPEAGRLPSQVLGLHLEAEGSLIRLYNPATGRRLLNRLERLEEARIARLQVDTAIQQKDAMIQEMGAVIQRKDAATRQIEEENERLRRELEALRSGSPPKSKPRPKKGK